MAVHKKFLISGRRLFVEIAASQRNSALGDPLFQEDTPIRCRYLRCGQKNENRFWCKSLSDDFLHHSTVNIRQTKISTAVSVGQFFVIQTHEVQDRCVKIMHMHFILDRRESKFIG